MSQSTSIPGFGVNFQAGLAVSGTMAVALVGRTPFKDASVPSAPTNAHASGSESPQPLAVLKERSVFGS